MWHTSVLCLAFSCFLAQCHVVVYVISVSDSSVARDLMKRWTSCIDIMLSVCVEEFIRNSV